METLWLEMRTVGKIRGPGLVAAANQFAVFGTVFTIVSRLAHGEAGRGPGTRVNRIPLTCKLYASENFGECRSLLLVGTHLKPQNFPRCS